jgi:hypothetical protein
VVPSYLRWFKAAYAGEMVLLYMQREHDKGKYGDAKGKEKVGEYFTSESVYSVPVFNIG